MSLLRARSASLLRGYAGSRLRAFGPGIKTHVMPGESCIQMTWEAEWFSIRNDNPDTILSTTGGSVLFHERMYHVMIWLMGSSNGRGATDSQSLRATAFTAGSADITNDLVSSNGFTTHPLLTQGTNWRFTGFANNDTPALPVEAPVIDTGTSLELRAEILIGSSQQRSVTGVYLHHPKVLVPNPSDPNPSIAEDWIIGYIFADGAISVDGGADPQERILIRLKVTLSV